MNDKCFSSENNQKNEDNRYLPRWEVANRIDYQLRYDAEKLQASTVDLSCCGARIRTTNKNFSEGQNLKLQVFLSEGECVDLNGTVMWTKEEDSQVIAGLRFFNTTEESQEAIIKHAFELDRAKLRKIWYGDFE